MDINCPVCGEPWEMDTLHYVDGMAFKEAYLQFQKKGCLAFGANHNETPDKRTAETAAVLMELLGDDVDGVASMLDDWRHGY